jgi:Tol biopolymer transport system component
VHRDLKPSNIVLLRSGTRDGVPQVKVLDFGLARITAKHQDSQETLAPLTGVGMLVGTVPYMSPEQVEGRDTDARSDIFSLGSVIYEMATGRRAFDAGSQAGVIAAILDRHPEPITQIEPMAPAGLERVVRTCLAKAPDDRWQHASDIARQLSWLAAESDSGAGRLSSVAPAGVAAGPGADRSGSRAIPWPHIVAGLALLLLAGDIGWRLVAGSTAAAPAAKASAAHFALSVPGVAIDLVRVSPDGRTLAISGTREDGRSGAWLQKLADGRAEQIPNLDADARLFGWSLDGTELAFRTTGGLVAVRPDGGPVRPLTPVLPAPVTTWGATLLAGGESGIRAFAIGTGAPRDLITGLALRPRFLPDGQRFLYTSLANAQRQGNPDGLYLSSVDAPQERRLILSKRSSGVYADGHLLFVEDSTLFAQPFDLSRAELSGTATPVLDGVQYFHPNGSATFDAGAGTIAYATLAPDDSPVWVDRRGAITGKLGVSALYREPRVSPDGTRALYYRMDRRRGTGDVWLQDLARHTTVRLTNDEWSEGSLIWSPDGKTIAYGSDRDGPPDVYVQEVDSGTPPRKLFGTAGVEYPVSWLPGGRMLIMTPTGHVVVRPDGTIENSMTDLPPGDRRGAIQASHDGRWLALSILENGEPALYVQPLGRTGVRVRVSATSATQPSWSRDGRWLYFVSKRRMMQAAVRPGDTFASDPPVELFTLERDIVDFDISPDGERFLIRRSPPPDYLPYHVLVNWRAAMK